MDPAQFASPPGSACTPGPAGGDGPDRITRTIYDAAGQRVQLREGAGTSDEGTEATWAYNASGQVTAVIDGNGNRAELRYDGHGRQDRWTFPSPDRPTSPPYNDATQATALATAGSVNAADYEEYGYDAAGNRTSLRKRDGRSILYAYDALGRVTARTYPQGGARPVHYSYNLQNLQLTARFDSPTGEGISNDWDAFGRLAATTTTMGGTTRTLAYRYDANGNRTRITHPDPPSNPVWFSTDYDALNRPVMLWANGVTAMASMGYYPHGAPAGRSLANGATSEWGFDGVQRVSAVVQNAAGTSADLFLSLSYNPASQIASRTLSNDSYAWTGHYAVSRSYITNGLNQYARATATTAAGPSEAGYAYDANGNLTSDGSRTYAYDIENRLVSSSNGATLTYDPLGRLFQVTLGASTTRFLWDGDDLVAEYDGANVMQRRYAHWVGADVPLLSYAGATLNQPSYLHSDQQGSIILVTDQSGNPNINRYDEYGIPAATNTGRFQYTGQIRLPEIGMYYYKARIYSPTLGRFLQTDPIGYDDQFNLYAYVGDDPVNQTDPGGTCANPSESRICAQEAARRQAFENARRAATRAAWRQERAMVARGEGGTRRWTAAQREELLREGSVSGMEGHHRNTVNGNNLAMAADPDNIEFRTHDEHVRIHRAAGGCRAPICGRPLLSRAPQGDAASVPARGFGSRGAGRALGATGALGIGTGIISGRIRTDAGFINFMYNLIGLPGAQDIIEQNLRDCGTPEECA